jgi:glycerol dehydrogenase-like iron-containing ADH family enzyme
MSKKVRRSPLGFVRTGPAQYVNRAGILTSAGECIALWGNRALISGGEKALKVAEEQVTKSLNKAAIKWSKLLFSGETSPRNISRIKKSATDFQANVIVGIGGGRSLDAAKQAATELGLPAICIPTIAATCSATTALSVIYNDRAEFQRVNIHIRNPSLVLVDPGIVARAPSAYLRAGILDSLAKWYEGRAVLPSVQNPDVQTTAAFQLAEVLYKSHRKYAVDALHLNEARRVDDALIQTVDAVLLLTGMIQTLAKGTLFTGLAHPVHNGLTLMKESHEVLHGLKVGYGIMVQLSVQNCPKEEFEDALSFFRQLGLDPCLRGLNLPFDRELIMRVADKAANDPDIGPLNFPVNKFVIASAIENLEKRLA